MDELLDENSLVGAVRVFLFADDIITSSPFSHSNNEVQEAKQISFDSSIECPHLQNIVSPTSLQDGADKIIPTEIIISSDEEETGEIGDAFKHESVGEDALVSCEASSSSSSWSASESSSGSESSSESTSETSDDSMYKMSIPSFLNFLKNKEGFIPIDIQYSFPAMLIIILYSFAHIGFYDLATFIFTRYLSTIYPKRTVCNILNMTLGFIIMRCTGGLWDWSTECIDSEPYYYQFKQLKTMRKQMGGDFLAWWTSNMNNNRGTQDANEKRRELTRVEAAKRSLLVIDTRTMKWFKKHWIMAYILDLFAFYCVYNSCYDFYSNDFLWFASIPRHDLISGLPSLTMIPKDSMNTSPVFRNLLVPGPSPNLSEEEMKMWNGSQNISNICSAESCSATIGIHTDLSGDAAAVKNSIVSNFTTVTCSTDTCPAVDENHPPRIIESASVKPFLEFAEKLGKADANYIYSKVSPTSYYSFYGWEETMFLNQYRALGVGGLVIGLSLLLLKAINVDFFDM